MSSTSQSPSILFGLETEFGITRHTDAELDVVAESIALVRAAREPGIRMRWDYSCEDPHHDARGFHVRELRQDTDEANYFEQDARRPMSFSEIKSDLVLSNGARFYNDHAHPEYCTPECASPGSLVIQDRAGEQIAMACARHRSNHLGERVVLYKNNTDFRGHSYGCHENYLLPRSLAWSSLVRGVEAFLVTRQIFTGAGKFGHEEEDRFVSAGFQISQRSDFFSELQSVDTMQRRPIINTRDEPHADPALWRRFHVILGDANMSPFATWLKVGTTALVLELLTRHPGIERSLPQLQAPLESLRQISRDPSWAQTPTHLSAIALHAIQVQRDYLRAIQKECDTSVPERKALLEQWQRILDDLEIDPMRCRDRLDWVAKHCLIREFQQAEALDDKDPWLRSLDLAYHQLDPEEGLYAGLEQIGQIQGVPEESEVRAAMHLPPSDTRAAIRGGCIRKFPSAVLAAQWDHVILSCTDGPWKLSLMDLFATEEILRYREMIERASTPDELRSWLNL